MFFGAARRADLALFTRLCDNPLAGPRVRTPRPHGCHATQPAISPSGLVYIQTKECGKVFTAEDLAGSRRLLRLRKSPSGPRDEFLFVHVVQPEDEVGLLIQPCADSVEHGCHVLAHIGPIWTTA